MHINCTLTNYVNKECFRNAVKECPRILACSPSQSTPPKSLANIGWHKPRGTIITKRLYGLKKISHEDRGNIK